ncbi:MAG: hypothetical protein IH989_08755 [Planctomycetes bacterium]|nr:hypothetical protein [Planctomycetota bacterium]
MLIVSLTGDAVDLDTGRQPYIPQQLRAENLAALMFVDHVYIDPSPTAEAILGKVKPDIFVIGREHERSTAPAFRAERAVVERYGGRIIFSSGELVFSSAELIERMPRDDRARSHRLNLLTQRHEITARGLDDVMQRFRNMHVLVVGDVVIDQYVFCDTLGVASESPMMTLAERDRRSYVGGAAIVARHLAGLGAHAFLLTAGGSDERSRMVKDVLSAEDVELHMIESRPSMVEKTRFVADETKLFKVDHGQRLPLDSVAERRAAQLLEQQAKVADAVIFCDFGYGMVTGGLLARILPTLRQNVSTLTADVSGGQAKMLSFEHVDLLCPTERELRATLNDYESGLSAVAWEVMHRTQARHLFVTLEKRGMIVFERRSQDRASPEWSGRLISEQLPSFSSYAVDRLGCGDALLATATLALAAGSSLIEAAYLGNAAAAIEIAMLGNLPIDADRLKEWLGTRHELSRTTSQESMALTTS